MTLPESGPKQTASTAEGKNATNRLQARLPVQRQVHICWQDGQGSRVLVGRAIDISRFGMLVEAEKAIAPGTLVSVQTNSMMIGKACVRHCTPKGARYRIGLHMPDRMVREL